MTGGGPLRPEDLPHPDEVELMSKQTADEAILEEQDIDGVPSVDDQPPYDLSDEDAVAFDDGVDLTDGAVEEPTRPEAGIVPDNPDVE